MKKKLPTIAIATTLKCPPEQSISFVRYNLNLGIDHIYLFFDDPEDSAIGTFAGDSRVTETRCDTDYWNNNVEDGFKKFDIQYLVNRQRINATNALNWSRKIGIDWISHIDVDELIYYSSNSIKKYLARTPFKIIRLTLLEAVPDRYDYVDIFTETTIFKKPAVHNFPTILRFPWNSLMLFLAITIGVKSPFQINDNYFRAHTKSKVIVRTDLDIQDMKIHGPLTYSSHITFTSKRLFLLHFDSCGFDFWIDRWKFKLSGAAKPKPKEYRSKISFHMNELFTREPDENELKVSYAKLHFINQKDISILKHLGLIKFIRLSRELFE